MRSCAQTFGAFVERAWQEDRDESVLRPAELARRVERIDQDEPVVGLDRGAADDLLSTPRATPSTGAALELLR